MGANQFLKYHRRSRNHYLGKSLSIPLHYTLQAVSRLHQSLKEKETMIRIFGQGTSSGRTELDYPNDTTVYQKRCSSRIHSFQHCASLRRMDLDSPLHTIYMIACFCTLGFSCHRPFSCVNTKTPQRLIRGMFKCFGQFVCVCWALS